MWGFDIAKTSLQVSISQFAPGLRALRVCSTQCTYGPCSKRTCLIGSLAGDLKMRPNKVISRSRHVSDSLTCLYFVVSVKVLILFWSVLHVRSTCVGGTCKTRRSTFIWNASVLHELIVLFLNRTVICQNDWIQDPNLPSFDGSNFGPQSLKQLAMPLISPMFFRISLR